MKEEKKIINIVAEDENLRLDSYLSNLGMFSRSQIKKMILDGDVFVNERIVKPSYFVSYDDKITIKTPQLENCDIMPEENINFSILYEDDDIAVIDKPQGLIIHPTNALRTGTLVNGLLYKLNNLSGINGILRPGIVHRIDKDTSGLLVVAKNDVAHNSLAKQIREKSAKRSYLALNEGIIKEDKGIIETDIGRNPKDRKSMAVVKVGKHAITNYTVLERFNQHTYTQFDLQTGRTHQIRVHSKFIGHPIVGDKVYGYSKQRFNLNGQLLHAYKLELTHPTTNKRMIFTSEIPNYFQEVLNILKKEKDKGD